MESRRRRAGTFGESILYFLFGQLPIDRVFAKPFTCRFTVLALDVVDVVILRESVLSHELVS